MAARNSDEKDTGWVQILAFVILAIFYAVGSIVKARANKTAPKGKEQKPRKPARKSPDLQILKQFFGLPEEPESSSQSSPEEPELQVIKPQVRPSGRKVARPAIPRVQPKLEKVPELSVAMPQAKSAAPTEKPQSKYLSEILSDYDDTEKLRRAILHYEILGKPLSLRDSQGYT